MTVVAVNFMIDPSTKIRSRAAYEPFSKDKSLGNYLVPFCRSSGTGRGRHAKQCIKITVIVSEPRSRGVLRRPLGTLLT